MIKELTKFETVYSLLIEQLKQKYKVSCLKYGVSGNGPDDTTFASSKEQALSYVAVKFAQKSGFSREQYGRFINEFKKYGYATLVT